MKDCDGIFHLAGAVLHTRTGGRPAINSNFPDDLYETNVTYSVNVVRAAGIAK